MPQRLPYEYSFPRRFLSSLFRDWCEGPVSRPAPRNRLEAVEGVAAAAALAAVATLAAVGGVADAVLGALATAIGLRAGVDHRRARVGRGAGVHARVGGRPPGPTSRTAAASATGATGRAQLRNSHTAGGGGQSRGTEGGNDCLPSLHVSSPFLGST